MSTTSLLFEASAAPKPVHPTLCAAFQATVAAHPDRVALRTPGDQVRLTWREYGERVRETAGRLAKLGVRRGDTVALMLSMRPEAALVDAAAMHLGAVGVSLYLAETQSSLAYVLSDAGARILVTERALADRAAGLGRACAALEHVAGIDGTAPGVTALDDVAADPGFDFDATWAATRPDDLLTLMYTSGTTGAPRGAVYTHGAMGRVFACLDASLPPLDDISGVAFIPFAHAGQRAFGHYRGMIRGSTTTFCADPASVPAVVSEARPTCLLAPPGIWARLAAALTGDVSLARLGLDRLVQPIVTGAPSPPGLLERLHAAGVPVMNMYALTEVPPVAITTTDPADIGTAGAPLRGVEVRVEDDGEILVRHPGASSGYHGRPAQTAALFDPDGWAHTGDLGRLDDKGRLTITGRRDEQIVTSLGTNIDPVALEQALMRELPQIAHACVIGHGREHLVALINVPDAEDAAIAAAVECVNERVPETGRIRRFCVLREPWRPGGGEMTPTMKLRRKAIQSRYADEIATMYRPVQGDRS